MYKNYTLRTGLIIGLLVLSNLFFCKGSLFAQETVTDIDGNVYQAKEVANTVWTTSNLKVKHYRNGDPIPQVTDEAQWNSLTKGAWCYFNNDPSTEDEYGLLYNWYAIGDARGLTPDGWEVAGLCDYLDLTQYFGYETAGKVLRDTTTWLGERGFGQATNESGLGFRGGGHRVPIFGNGFSNFGFNVFLWTKNTNYDFLDPLSDRVPAIGFQSNEAAYFGPGMGGNFTKNWGAYIRIVKKKEPKPIEIIEIESCENVTSDDIFNIVMASTERPVCGNWIWNTLYFNSFNCFHNRIAGQGPMLSPRLFKGSIDSKELNHSFVLEPDVIYYYKLSQSYWEGAPGALECNVEYIAFKVVQTTPPAPEAEAEQIFCSSATIDNIQVTGENVRWFSSATSNEPLSGNTLLQTGTRYYAESISGTCSSATRTEVLINLINVSKPTGSETQEFCQDATVSQLIYSGANTRVEDEFGNLLDSDQLLVEGSKYLIFNKEGDCSSEPLEIKVNLKVVEIPTAVATQEFCPGARVSELSATGQNILWYTAATGGSPLDTETPLSEGTSYFATQTLDGCESRSRREVRVSLLAVPPVTAPQIQEFCNTATVSNLQATGSNIRWYADQNLTNELNANSPLEDGRTYYATQTIEACEGPATSVHVSINAVSTPQGDSDQGFCTGALVSDLVATGINVRWYSTATGGNPLPSNTVLQNGSTYYAEQTIGSCNSADRQAVRVSLSSVDLPAASANQTLCTGATISDIEVTGQSIRWYGSATGNDLLANTTLLVDGRTYFATQTIGGCESATRRSVQVRVVNVSPVTAPQTQSICNTATVNDLQATGSNIRWYADQNLTNELSSNSPLEDGRTYYATQSEEGCQSTAVAVQVSITQVSPPTGNTDQEFCSGAFISDLNANGTAVQWFPTATGGSPLAGNLPLQDGATYYAEQTLASCQSATRLEVRVRINIPQDPGGPSQQEFCEGARVSELQATGSNLIWYRNSTGPETLNPNDPIQDGGNYFVSQRIGNCESARKEVRASIIRVQPAIAEGEQQFCESDSPTIRNLFAVGESIRWYSSATGGQPLNDSERLIDGQIYYAVNVSLNRGCESSTRTPVRVIVQPCEVEVFNMVTRDGNNKNEYLKIKNIESFPDNRLEIYNRYGVLVWAAEGYGQDGKFFNGESNRPGVSQPELGLPTGNYLYALTYKKPGSTLPIRETGYLYLLNIQRK